MENIEIVLSDFDKKHLPDLIYKAFKLPNTEIISSHFYDCDLERDVSFSEIKNIEQILSPEGTGNIVLKELGLGVPVKNIVLVLSFDEKVGDVVLNFPEHCLLKNEREQDQENMKKIAAYLMDLKENYSVPKVIIGYEPATDEDSLFIEITDYDRTNEDIEKIFGV